MTGCDCVHFETLSWLRFLLLEGMILIIIHHKGKLIITTQITFRKLVFSTLIYLFDVKHSSWSSSLEDVGHKNFCYVKVKEDAGKSKIVMHSEVVVICLSTPTIPWCSVLFWSLGISPDLPSDLPNLYVSGDFTTYWWIHLSWW